MKQPEALFLADVIDADNYGAAETQIEFRTATELRRLHSLNQELLEALNKAESSLSDYHAGAEWGHYDLLVLNAVRNVIEKVEEQMK